MPSVNVAVGEYIATVVINRLMAMHSIYPGIRAPLRETRARIADDDDTGVAIITCAGENAFCTDSDLKKSMPAQISDWLVPCEYGRSEITFIHEQIGRGGAS